MYVPGTNYYVVTDSAVQGGEKTKKYIATESRGEASDLIVF